jgi:hypothetical protein
MVQRSLPSPHACQLRPRERDYMVLIPDQVAYAGVTGSGFITMLPGLTVVPDSFDLQGPRYSPVEAGQRGPEKAYYVL